jgi:Fe-S oxidoreductase
MDSAPTDQTDTGFTLDDALWQRLLDLTDGAAAPCFQCGACTAACPWDLVRPEPLSVRKHIRSAQLGLRDQEGSLWLCTTCAQCQALCPRGVDVAQVMRGLRYLAWEQREMPEGLSSLLWSVYWNNNPWSQPPSQRNLWAQGLDVPEYDPREHEILYYVGCTPAYERRAQLVAQALIHVLGAAQVPFGTLGDAEPCCGETALDVGHRPYFEELAQQAIDIFQQREVSRIVTTSPHCWDVFCNHYPSTADGFIAWHYTQYLATLLDQGRLDFKGSLPLRATYHDPCYLGRHNDIYQAPRQILAAIPDLELVEMPHSRSDALCCGGGGGRMWLETAAGERFSDLRTQEARSVGAQVLVTACPFCIICLEDSIKDLGIAGLRVMDVAELAALALT